MRTCVGGVSWCSRGRATTGGRGAQQSAVAFAVSEPGAGAYAPLARAAIGAPSVPGPYNIYVIFVCKICM
eukprot:COSAG03_NODE_1968_length_3280_cov_21.156869_4_plen_70_part_00